jgi:hypothetical protein
VITSSCPSCGTETVHDHAAYYYYGGPPGWYANNTGELEVTVDVASG